MENINQQSVEEFLWTPPLPPTHSIVNLYFKHSRFFGIEGALQKSAQRLLQYKIMKNAYLTLARIPFVSEYELSRLSRLFILSHILQSLRKPLLEKTILE